MRQTTDTTAAAHVKKLSAVAMQLLVSVLVLGWALFPVAAGADTFTVPQTELLNNSEFGTLAWGSGTLTRTDVGGASVDFAFTGLSSSSFGIRDNYPVGTFYGQILGGENADFTNFGGGTLLVENLDDQTISFHLFMNTGFTGASGNPPNDPSNDTFWGGPWYDIGPGQKVVVALDFSNVEAYNITDNKVPHSQGGLSSPDGAHYSINTNDRGEVSAIGFEVADFANTNPAGTLRLTPYAYSTGPNIVCTPDPATLSVASPTTTISVDYLGGGSASLYAYSLKFSWDGTNASTATGSVAEGSLLSSQGATFFSTQLSGTNEITVDCALLGAQAGVDGPGRMFTIDFTGLAPGTSPVDITILQVRDNANNPLTGITEDDGLLVVDVQAPVVTGVAIANVTLAHTDDYIKDGDAATVTATVTDDDPGFGIGNIAADLSGLGGGSSDPPASYAATVATWNLASVTCTPGDGTVTVTVTATDAVANSANGNDGITADNTAPTAMTGFDAAPHHERVEMSWDDGGATDLNYRGVRVRYDVGGDYPNYVTLGSYPADENGGDGDAFDGTGAVLGADHNIVARDIYYYTAFVYDQALNYGPAAASAQDRSTNYWLGDVDVDTGPGGGDYDGDVDFNDISVLSAAYFGDNPTSPGDECDVGPSDDATGTGIPQPDDNVGFEDLILFALNFGVVTPTSMLQPVALPGAAGSGPPMLRLEAAAATAEDDAGLAVRLVLDGNADQVKGASVVLHYDPATLTLADLSRSRALASRLLFFASREAAPGEIWIDLAAIGTGQTIHGSGTLAELRFTFKADGDRSVRFGAVKLRSVDNQELGAGTQDLALDPGTTLPTVTRLLGAAPNPFKPATSIRFELSRTGPVTVRVFDAQGRRVRTLINHTIPPGQHAVTWDGRDERGFLARSGAYFVTMTAGAHRSTAKMILAR